MSLTLFFVEFFAKRTEGWQRGTWGREKIRIIALKNRAMSQYGGGMGGVLSIKKILTSPPANFCT